MTATATVEFEVVGFVPVTGAGRLVGLAASVLLDIEGVPMRLDGFQVRQGRGDMLTCHPPQHRTPAGEWRSCVALPSELLDAIGAEVLALGYGYVQGRT